MPTTKGKHLRKYYMTAYPSDTLGPRITANVTFKQLHDALVQGLDVYHVIGVGDSLVRERLFTRLAQVYNVPYDTVYKLWLRK